MKVGLEEEGSHFFPSLSVTVRRFPVSVCACDHSVTITKLELQCLCQPPGFIQCLFHTDCRPSCFTSVLLHLCIILEQNRGFYFFFQYRLWFLLFEGWENVCQEKLNDSDRGAQRCIVMLWLLFSFIWKILLSRHQVAFCHHSVLVS